ncbi:transporter substrate-binding domain-containing protein [Lacticaseibacillus zhaodongensis]|uniref:transporter substrate-binding domain-containing protein n=1 Tax=Lacticaseibacillus zhaodongensis TaxID=2668065 RepID=UPI0012D35372|nr:transporter substrate-binding domain-containing protein [Lacticaseibacillus zhaodongensis]
MKINANGLKKTLVGAAALASVILLAACGKSSSSSSSQDTYKSNLVKKGELTIGLEGTYEPYSFRKDGKLTGFEVDLGKAVAKKLDLKPNFVPTKWDSLVAGLGSGKYDIVMNNITQTAARRKVYLFSEPYVYSRYALITKTGNKSIKSVADIKGKKFAEGTGTDNAVVAKKFGATIVPQGEFATSLQLIKQGRVDGSINATTAWYAFKKSNATTGLKLQVLKDSDQKPAKASALFAKKNGKLRTKYNKALDELRKDGTLKKLSVKYFGADITK